MKKRTIMATALTMGLTMLLTASMAGCGNSEGSESGVADAADTNTSGESSAGNDAVSDDEVVTLTIWNSEVMSPGIQDNDVAKAIEEKLGIKMDIVQGDSQKFSLLVAGGRSAGYYLYKPGSAGG